MATYGLRTAAAVGLLALTGLSAPAQTTAAYSFNGALGTLNPTTASTGLTAGGFSAANTSFFGSLLVGVTPEYSYDASAVSGATLSTSTSTYFSVSFTPNAGDSVKINSIEFKIRNLTTGGTAVPTNFAVYANSTSGGLVQVSAGTPTLSNTLTNYQFNGVNYTGGTDQAVEVRIYAYGAGGGTISGYNVEIDDASFSLTPVPEPLGLLAAAAGLLALRRRLV